MKSIANFYPNITIFWNLQKLFMQLILIQINLKALGFFLELSKWAQFVSEGAFLCTFGFTM